MQASPMRMRTFSFHPPRHPLLRALLLLCGMVLLVGLVTVGFVVGVAVLAVAVVTLLMRRWLHSRRRAPRDPDIIEGEFTVVSRPRAALPHAE
jgi:hypothetical protein